MCVNAEILRADLWFLLHTVNKDELRVEDCERQLTTNMLNVVAALALRSIRNTGTPKYFGCLKSIFVVEFTGGIFYR